MRFKLTNAAERRKAYESLRRGVADMKFIYPQEQFAGSSYKRPGPNAALLFILKNFQNSGNIRVPGEKLRHS